MTAVSRSRTYRCWQDMKQRCLNPNAQAYKDYGARGITVCDSWQESFANFLADMGEAPDGMSLDRKNNDLGYSPNNCRWATQKQQSRNHRGCVFLEYQNKRMTIVEWSERTGINANTLQARYAKGWDIDSIFRSEKMRPVKARKDNQSGLIGASKHKDKWKSQIKIDGKVYYLGLYATVEQAHQVYMDARAKLREKNGGEYRNGATTERTKLSQENT